MGPGVFVYFSWLVLHDIVEVAGHLIEPSIGVLWPWPRLTRKVSAARPPNASEEMFNSPQAPLRFEQE